MVLLLFFGVNPVSADPLKKARKQLSKLDTVSGSAVGFGGSEGNFHRLGRSFLKLGDENQFKALLESDHVVTRAMGLYCLARTGGAKYKDVLIEHLGGREKFEYMPGGCVGWNSTEGSFALTLLQNTNAINMGKQREAIDETELRSIAIEHLAKDECQRIHYALIELLGATGYPDSYAALVKEAPTLSGLERVKAAGRFPANGTNGDLLASVLKDGKLPVPVRLAAASGITRYRVLDAHDILAEAKFFDEIEGGEKLREGFIKALREQEAQWHCAQKIAQEKTWRGMEKIEEVVVAANSVRHPLGLAMISRTKGLSIWRSHESVRETQLKTLTEIVANLKQYTQPWNTWSDAPYEIEEYLGGVLEDAHSDLPASEEKAWRSVLKSVQSFLAKAP